MGLGSASGEARRCPKRAFTVEARRLHCGLSCKGKPWFREAANAEGSPNPATLRFLLLPPCFLGFRAGVEEAKTVPKDRFKSLISPSKSGAGEGIRTPDPNLGKVVLYP